MQLFKALICQILAGLVVAWVISWLGRFSIGLGWLILLQAVCAALLSGLLHQPPWWQPIHLLFLPAAWLMLSFQIPAWLYLVIFLLLLLAFWGTVKGDVPLFLSSTAVTEALVGIVCQQQAATLIELGAGIGSVVVPLAQRLPALTITALEHAPLPWLILRWRCRKLANINVQRRSLWDCDLANYDLAFAFLSPLVMVRLGDKVRQQMRTGAWLVSSSFLVPDWQAETTIELADRRKTQLFCYQVQSEK